MKDSIIDYEVQLLNPQVLTNTIVLLHLLVSSTQNRVAWTFLMALKERMIFSLLLSHLLCTPKVKLHGAKSSVILSVFRASAQAITLNTLVSTNHNEEGQATSRSRSPTIQRDYIISQVRGTGSKQTTPISHKVPPSQQDEEIGVGQTRLRSPVQHPKSLAMYQTSTTPTDNHTSFDTCLDDGRASSSTTVHTTATSTELPEHESPTPSMLNTSSNQAPTVLRYASCAVACVFDATDTLTDIIVLPPPSFHHHI